MNDSPSFDGIPETGDVLLGKYRVEQLLGFGGMGAVVAATHLGLDQRVAIKFLLAKAAQNPQAVKRFEREARAAAKIRSEHVARVSDIGSLENGIPFMVMEFLDGKDLAELCKAGPLSISSAVDYLLQSAEALAEAHQAGIVHRDLKPANLFLAKTADGDSHIKVLDFGISKIATAPGDSEHLTKTSALLGSPLYMAPEQMVAPKTVDQRADIWALGTILYQLVGGTPPFLANSLPEVCGMVLQKTPTAISSLNSLVPVELETVIDRCLAKKPEDRYADLAAFAEALAPFGSQEAKRSLRIIQRIIGTAEPAPVATSSPASAPTLHATEPSPESAPPPIPTTERGSPPTTQLNAPTPEPDASKTVTIAQTPPAAPDDEPDWLLHPGASTAEPVMKPQGGHSFPQRAKRTWIAGLILAAGLLLFFAAPSPESPPPSTPAAKGKPTEKTLSGKDQGPAMNASTPASEPTASAIPSSSAPPPPSAKTTPVTTTGPKKRPISIPVPTSTARKPSASPHPRATDDELFDRREPDDLFDSHRP